LSDIGVNGYDQNDFEKLVQRLSLNGEMNGISRFAGGHLFSLYGKRTALEEQIAINLGGMTPSDFEKLDLFRNRTIELTDYADSKNCSLYVDAE
jgi:hypothetical protein